MDLDKEMKNSDMRTIEMQKCSICKNFVPKFDIR